MKPYFLRGGIIVSASRPDGLWDQPHCGCIIWAAGSAASQPYWSVWLFPLKISSVWWRTWPWPGTLYFRALFDKGHFTATFPLYKFWLKQFVTTWTFPQLFFLPKSCGIVWLTWWILLSQGVCHAFSKAYHHICMRENILQVAVTALDWLHPRTPSIHTVTTYLVAPGKDKVLQGKGL